MLDVGLILTVRTYFCGNVWMTGDHRLVVQLGGR